MFIIALRHMKTLLRQTNTRLYFQAPGKWTDDPSRALDFRFIDRALVYAGTWGIKDIELAFAFDDPLTVTTVSLERTAVHYAGA